MRRNGSRGRQIEVTKPKLLPKWIILSFVLCNISRLVYRSNSVGKTLSRTDGFISFKILSSKILYKFLVFG